MGPITPMIVVIVPSAFLIVIVSMLPPAAVVPGRSLGVRAESFG